jgi:RNA polymerase sigma-70 factor (ECF subfamily)
MRKKTSEIEIDGQKDKGQQFMRLYLTVQPRLYGFLISMIPNWSDVDDVLQETVSVMWSKFETFEEGTDFAAWSLAIARYRALTYYQSHKKQQLCFSEEALEKISDEALAANVERENHFVEALKTCVSNLQSKDRKILEMRYEIGASVKDVAARVNENLNTVYKKLNRLHVILLHCIYKNLFSS